ncbi:MAG: acyl-[acyl-carrier-protein]--UDP-N-acetylglucosamine O-acyltransferase [Phycisphaerales bacterium]
MTAPPSVPGIHPSSRVDSGALVDPSATIAEGAIVERFAVVGPRCVIGPGTRLRTHSVVVEHTTLGANNDVHPFATLGGDPQDRAFKGDDRGLLIIGDRNIFREGVTLNRASPTGPPTRLGNANYFMTDAHAGHNCVIGDNNTFANGAMLAGHVRMGSGCVLSGGCAVHQFTNIGDGVMFQGGAMMGMHVPPYMVVTEVNLIAGINRVGMRRNPELNPADREDIKVLFRAMFRDRAGAPMLACAKELQASRQWGTAGTRFLNFIIDALNEQGPRARGICAMDVRARADEAAHSH